MILIAKRNGSIKAIDMKFCKVLEVSDKHLWVALSETASEGILLSETLTGEQAETLFELLLRRKNSDGVYDIDDLVEAVKGAEDGEAQHVI